jgi:23S rRNA (guanosine2251-2'-O)-methyltransferase
VKKQGNNCMREWIRGRNPVYEVLRSGKRRPFRLIIAKGTNEKGKLADIITLCKQKSIPFEYAERDFLDQLGSNHQGIALETGTYHYCDLDEIIGEAEQRSEDNFILILDTLQDPQNLGTLLRTAEVIGIHGVILPKRNTATITPSVVSASSGASEYLQITQMNIVQAIRQLKQNDIWVIGLEGSTQAQNITDIRLDGNLALVVGNEGQGLRPLVRDSCDLLMRIPMRGNIESLNASVAGSIALFFAWHSRENKKKFSQKFDA